MQLDKIREDIRKTYSVVAQKYHDLFHNEMNEKEYDRALLDSFAKNFNEHSLLCDLGCGPSGHITRYMFDKGLNIEGIDISDKCIEIAAKVNPQMSFKVMDMTNLEYGDGVLDGVISFYSIIHTPSKYQSKIFSEFSRVLKKGGKALVVVKRGEDEGYINEILGYEAEIYFKNFVEEELESLFKTNGFKIDFMETRKPYEFEIDVSRIYIIGEKL